MIPGLLNLWITRSTISAFAYSEHLRATLRADALSRRFAILHGDGLGVFHFPFGTTLHTICFHRSPPFLACPHRRELILFAAVLTVTPAFDQAFNHRDQIVVEFRAILRAGIFAEFGPIVGGCFGDYRDVAGSGEDFL